FVAPEFLFDDARENDLRCRFLLVGLIEDGRSILRADIIPLPVACRRIVSVEKYSQKLFGAYLRGIEHDAHNLGVAGLSSDHVLVRRILQMSAREAGLNRFHAAEGLEDCFDAPEAPASEHQ